MTPPGPNPVSAVSWGSGRWRFKLGKRIFLEPFQYSRVLPQLATKTSESLFLTNVSNSFYFWPISNLTAKHFSLLGRDGLLEICCDLELTTHLFPNETHTTVIAMNYIRGLQSVYTRPETPFFLQMLAPPEPASR